MAKSIGTIPGVAGLGTTALQAGTALYKAIKSYQSHQQNVIDLLNETGDLNNALGSLNRTIASRKDLDLSALEFPLQRCEKACQEFKEAIEKISSLSGGNRASFRGWARLRCMGEDIDGFRRLLADYKSMINIALADATLQSSTLTAERIEGYTEMIQRAEANFEDRLQRIDGRLETLIKMTLAASGSEAEKAAAEVQQVQEERMNTEKYLQICTHLSEYIKNLLLDGRHSAASSTTSERDSVPERIASEGLEECAEAISRMANRLECYEMELFNRIVKAATSSSTSIGHEEEVKSLRDEWKSTREQMKILSKAERKLEEKVSVIQNRATGNAIQFMVSVNGRPIHGTNEGTGHWTNQVGGHMSNETLQQVMQGMVRMTLATCEDEKARRAEEKAKVKTTTMREEEEDRASSDGSKFEDLYGEGFTLDCESPTGSTLVNKRAR